MTSTQRTRPRVQLQLHRTHDRRWLILGVPGCCYCGPYRTKGEAEADRQGMERFYRKLKAEMR